MHNSATWKHPLFCILKATRLLHPGNILNSFFSKYFLGGFFFILYSALLHLPPLKFHCADGCWDRIIEPRTVATSALAVRRSEFCILKLGRTFCIRSPVWMKKMRGLRRHTDLASQNCLKVWQKREIIVKYIHHTQQTATSLTPPPLTAH